MPKAKALKPDLAHRGEENLLRDPPVPLTLDEREQFRAAVRSPFFQKALRNIRHVKPSAFIPNLNSALGATISNNRLHEIRGWEMFETALGTQALDPAPKLPQARETYIDESTQPPAK